MKKYLLFFAVCLILTSCASSQKKMATNEETETRIKQKMKKTIPDSMSFGNHAYLTEADHGIELVVFGLIEKTGSTFLLHENPESRSRVSFILDVDETLAVDFEKLVGSNARVKVEITDASKTWTKYARVLEIVQ